MELHIDGFGVVRTKGLNKVRAKGKLYLYHRASGVRIDGIREVADRIVGSKASLRQIERLNTERPKAKPGTIGLLFDAYLESIEWKSLAPRTRKDYLKAIRWLSPEEGVADRRLRDKALAKLTTPIVLQIRDRAFKAHKRKFANDVVNVLSNACQWGRLRDYIESNPCEGVGRLTPPKDAPKVNRAWTPDELEAVLREARSRAPHLVLPILLGCDAGMRQGDAISAPVTIWDGQTLQWRARKNKELVVFKNLSARLVAALNEAKAYTPKGKVRPMLLCLNRFGASWSSDGSGFRASFFRFIGQLEERGLVGPGLTFHGLRTTFAERLAEAGMTQKQLQSALGDRSAAAVAIYTRDADKARLTSSVAEMLEGRAASSGAAHKNEERSVLQNQPEKPAKPKNGPERTFTPPPLIRKEKAMVPGAGIEPATRGFSIRCSTN